MTQPAPRTVYEFSGFRLDPLQRLLHSHANDRAVTLTAKAFDALLYMVERHGELLDKQSLMQALWPNVIVEENNLNQIISALRKALGETPGEHRYIVTVPGRGYRFVAQVTVGEPSAASPSAAPVDVRGAHRSASNTAPRASIAVLPFVNLTGDPGKEYLSDGLAEELIGALGRVPGLQVPARSSSFAYKRRETDARQIAHELDAGVVLEGAVRSAGERIRATVQLVDGQTGYQLWSQSYDRRFTDLFDLQDDLANEIVRALGKYLRVNLSETSAAPGSTQDLQAYDLYLQARSLIDRYSAENLGNAKQLLREATKRDPHFAQAYSALATAHLLTHASGIAATPAELADAESAARQALFVDSDLIEARARVAQVRGYRLDWLGARREYSEALDSDCQQPSLHHGLAYLLVIVGQIRDAMKEAQTATRLAPSLTSCSVISAAVHSIAGSDEEAVHHADKAVNLGVAPDNVPLVFVYANAAYRRGDMQEAVRGVTAAFSQEIRAAGGSDAVQVIYGALRDPSETRRAISTIHKLRSDVAAGDSNIVLLLLITWATMLADLDLAYEIADDIVAKVNRSGTAGGGAWGGLWVPEMRAFRLDPRFHALAERLRMVEYWQEYGPPDNCELRDGKLICH